MEHRNRQGLTEAEFLAQYDPNRFDRPAVTADMVLFAVTDQESDDHRRLPEKALQVLLVKRANHPFMGQWALPGGFVDLEESLDEAAARELAEETGITDIYMEQLYTWGDVGRDPRMRVISCAYLALAERSRLQVRAGDDAAEARWFTITESPVQTIRTMTEDGYLLEQVSRLTLRSEGQSLSGLVRVSKSVSGKATQIERRIEESQGIAFDHVKVLQYGLERLRTKTEWSDIAFHLMPPLFTMAELRQVYELILGRELHAGNFRRDVARFVEETNQVRSGGGHRSPKLFRFLPRWSENA